MAPPRQGGLGQCPGRSRDPDSPGRQGAGGRGIPADIEVTAHERPDRYTFKVVAGPVRPTGEFRFTSERGMTTVSFSLEAQLSGLKKLLMSGAVQKSMEGEMQALDRAKALLESA